MGTWLSHVERLSGQPKMAFSLKMLVGGGTGRTRVARRTIHVCSFLPRACATWRHPIGQGAFFIAAVQPYGVHWSGRVICYWDECNLEATVPAPIGWVPGALMGVRNGYFQGQLQVLFPWGLLLCSELWKVRMKAGCSKWCCGCHGPLRLVCKCKGVASICGCRLSMGEKLVCMKCLFWKGFKQKSKWRRAEW